MILKAKQLQNEWRLYSKPPYPHKQLQQFYPKISQ